MIPQQTGGNSRPTATQNTCCFLARRVSRGNTANPGRGNLAPCDLTKYILPWNATQRGCGVFADEKMRKPRTQTTYSAALVQSCSSNKGPPLVHLRRICVVYTYVPPLARQTPPPAPQVQGSPRQVRRTRASPRSRGGYCSSTARSVCFPPTAEEQAGGAGGDGLVVCMRRLHQLTKEKKCPSLWVKIHGASCQRGICCTHP